MANWKKFVTKEMLKWMLSGGHGGITAATVFRRCSNIKPDLMKGVTEDDVEKYLSDELKLDGR